jgi:hypothetical protein
VLGLKPVDDRHCRGAVHAQALRQIGLGDAGVVIDQPQHGNLLLRQIEIGERLGKVAQAGAVGQADVEPQDVVDRADITGFRVGRRNRVLEFVLDQ